MNVIIIGTGNMGRGIGYRFVSGRHMVTLLGQKLEANGKLAVELRNVAEGGVARSLIWQIFACLAS